VCVGFFLSWMVCQYLCSRSPRKSHVRNINYLLCIKWGIKFYSLFTEQNRIMYWDHLSSTLPLLLMSFWNVCWLGCAGAGKQFNTRLVPTPYDLMSAAVFVRNTPAVLQCHSFWSFQVHLQQPSASVFSMRLHVMQRTLLVSKFRLSARHLSMCQFINRHWHVSFYWYKNWWLWMTLNGIIRNFFGWKSKFWSIPRQTGWSETHAVRQKCSLRLQFLTMYSLWRYSRGSSCTSVLKRGAPGEEDLFWPTHLGYILGLWRKCFGYEM